tara:strand:- start:15090 stop:15950 length:861 start_codon:yes stop_codon:yes gene_type:complete
MKTHFKKRKVMTELAIKETGLSLEEISAQLGASSGTKGPSIPSLKINSNGEDANGNQIPLGAFFLNTAEDRVYAKEGVKLRAFSNHIQYQHWGDNGLINKSLLIKNQREEARDQLGGFMCGMPTYEQSKNMTPEERKQYEGRDRYRIIRGLVSYVGKTAQGKEITLENEPCVLSLKRRNYGPFWHDVVKRMPNGMNLWDFENVLKAEKMKTDKGAVYYVMRFSPQFGNPIPMDQLTYDSLAHVSGLVTSENKRIDEAFKLASTQTEEEQEAARILDAVETLDEDVG